MIKLVIYLKKKRVEKAVVPKRKYFPCDDAIFSSLIKFLVVACIICINNNQEDLT